MLHIPALRAISHKNKGMQSCNKMKEASGEVVNGHVQNTETQTASDSKLFLPLHVEPHDNMPREESKYKVHGRGPGWSRVSMCSIQLSRCTYLPCSTRQG